VYIGEVDATERDLELPKPVELSLMPTPVVMSLPVSAQRLQLGEIGAELPGLTGRLIGPPGARQPLP
jgi:hypothetical protein